MNNYKGKVIHNIILPQLVILCFTFYKSYSQFETTRRAHAMILFTLRVFVIARSIQI